MRNGTLDQLYEQEKGDNNSRKHDKQEYRMYDLNFLK